MDGQRNLGGGGFGRRGAQLMQAPASASPAVSQPPSTDWGDRFSVDWRSAGRLAAILSLAPLALLCLDALLSGTTLITPISPLFVNIMRGVGLALGVPLALFTVVSPAVQMGIVRKGLVLLFLPIFTAFAGGEAAWRIADWTEFSFSSAAYAPATYPIIRANRGRKGRRDSVEIDPFNLRDATAIAVPSAQFQSIRENASDYCITVMQRRSASGAIEILNDGVLNLSGPAPATLTECRSAKGAQ